jgi:double-strand break repair protein MRE11
LVRRAIDAAAADALAHSLRPPPPPPAKIKPTQGVWERDEVRREDSFRTFEEILQKAVEQRVDLVVRWRSLKSVPRARRQARDPSRTPARPTLLLPPHLPTPPRPIPNQQLLGGDLFHETSPPKAVLVRAVALLKKYCLGDRPVSVQLLSDERRCFASGRCNYLDPDLNVGLPVFTIHGNHDDATGAEYVSAVDVLSSAGLVNYFGKVVSCLLFCAARFLFFRVVALLPRSLSSSLPSPTLLEPPPSPNNTTTTS